MVYRVAPMTPDLIWGKKKKISIKKQLQNGIHEWNAEAF